MPSGVSQASAPAGAGCLGSAWAGSAPARALTPSNGTLVKLGTRRIRVASSGWPLAIPSSHESSEIAEAKPVARGGDRQPGRWRERAQAGLSCAQIGAAVDVDDLSGEVALLGLGEKERGGGNLVHMALARHRRRAVPERRNAGRGRPHRRDGSGRDDVGGDAPVAELDGECTRETREPGFARQIVRPSLGARVPGNATERDDASPALGDHARQGGLRAVERAVERDVDHATPGGVVEIEKIDLTTARGVAYENIDR